MDECIHYTVHNTENAYRHRYQASNQMLIQIKSHPIKSIEITLMRSQIVFGSTSMIFTSISFRFFFLCVHSLLVRWMSEHKHMSAHRRNIELYFSVSNIECSIFNRLSLLSMHRIERIDDGSLVSSSTKLIEFSLCHSLSLIFRQSCSFENYNN